MADVLVVDDEVDSCHAVMRLFERAGHPATCAFGGGEALALVHAIRFKLVVLDLRMPVVGGMEVLKDIRGNPATRDTPVIIFSAEGSPTAVDDAIAAGAQCYLTKPLSWADLYACAKPYL